MILVQPANWVWDVCAASAAAYLQLGAAPRKHAHKHCSLAVPCERLVWPQAVGRRLRLCLCIGAVLLSVGAEQASLALACSKRCEGLCAERRLQFSASTMPPTAS